MKIGKYTLKEWGRFLLFFGGLFVVFLLCLFLLIYTGPHSWPLPF